MAMKWTKLAESMAPLGAHIWQGFSVQWFKSTLLETKSSLLKVVRRNRWVPHEEHGGFVSHHFFVNFDQRVISSTTSTKFLGMVHSVQYDDLPI